MNVNKSRTRYDLSSRMPFTINGLLESINPKALSWPGIHVDLSRLSFDGHLHPHGKGFHTPISAANGVGPDSSFSDTSPALLPSYCALRGLL